MKNLELHERALEVSRHYRNAEAELLDAIQEIDQRRMFLDYECTSLFGYACRHLRLSENVALNLIQVARVSVTIPDLKNRVREGRITLSNARRIAPVINVDNQVEWLERAENLTVRELEREVARVRPKEAVRERASYVTGDRLKLELGISEEGFKKVRRVQDLLSQRWSKSASYEELLEALCDEFLHRHDPLMRAKRAKNPTEILETYLPGDGPPRAIPAGVRHEVNLRDETRCTHTDGLGNRCANSRWLELHHVQPVSRGGSHTTDNLTTLCWAHHRKAHRASP